MRITIIVIFDSLTFHACERDLDKRTRDQISPIKIINDNVRIHIMFIIDENNKNGTSEIK